MKVALIAVYLVVGALLAGAASEDDNAFIPKILVVTALWPIFVVAGFGRAIGARLGV